MKPLKIGNGAGFWGDDIDAPARLLAGEPDLDYLTLDYLAEVSMSIMAIQREKKSQEGYAGDFLDVFRSLIPFWKKGSPCKVVTNAGGLNPQALGQVCLQELNAAGIKRKIAVISGDNVLPQLKAKPELFTHLDTHVPLTSIMTELVTANAYLGASSIAEALALGADIVISGRIADPSLTVGPCLHHFGWKDYSLLAQATIAGHLIECGTQVTGGISTDWLAQPHPDLMGFPVVEINENGSFIITKPSGTGGAVTERTVKEQLLYEISDPACYLSPDVQVSFLGLSVKQQALNRVEVKGAIGKAPTDYYKVSATYRAGFKAEGYLTFFGENVVEKARRGAEVIISKVKQAGYDLAKTQIDVIGAGAVVPGIESVHSSTECTLRIAVFDPRKEAVERFSKQIAPLVTSGPQGTTGYTSGRPVVRHVFGFWPCLIARSAVKPQVELL